MALTPEEARVLACLIENGAPPAADALTLDAVRLACNQTTARQPVVTYDDRTVDAALLSLKSMGLVRFVQPSDSGRIVRYRQTADERWRLGPIELRVLAALVLRGPQTAKELGGGSTSRDPAVDDALDTLASRRPEPFAARLEPTTGRSDVRFASLLSDEPERERRSDVGQETSDAPAASGASLESLVAEVAFLRARVDRLEHELGLAAEPTSDRRREP